MSKTRIGIVHGRFQPPHNGHIKYILEALKHSEKILIGICTPNFCTKEEALMTGYPCLPEDNPLTFGERAALLRGALANEGISDTKYSFINFPSDYIGLEKIIPRDSVFLMSYSSQADDLKIEHLHKLGYKTLTILETGPRRTESGQNIRQSIVKNKSSWQKLVPKNVADFLKKRFKIKV